MRLKRLVLQGYKTFATKTEFEFDEGITAIVGPNGSGKSNIADAVRWVLGEQSYSTLRGKRTVDMIFSGSQSRPRAGMAQAILTLDNSEGWLPIDYSEVEIGRRAHRSGENEYILNGQKVRLKDVTDLLATSGLAERTYTIIGQGLVDKALSLKAEERRALFEEAAGINHYKSRRAETLRRLQETQRNLQRIHDILAEIRPRLNSLRRQATRAQNYEQLSADLKNLLQIWYGFRWEEAKAELRRVRETAESVEAKWQTSRQTLRVRQENADDLRRRIHQLQTQLSDAQNQRDAIRDQLENARREVAILHERRESVKRQLAETAQEIPPIQQLRDTAAAELAAATADLEAAQANLKETQQQLTQFNQTFQAQQSEINRWQTKLQDAQRQQRDTQTALAQSQGQLNQLRERLTEQESSDSSEDGEVVRLQKEVESLTAVLESANNSLDKLKSERDAVGEQRHGLIQQLKKLRREHREAENNINRQQKEIARLEARVDMLDQLRLKEVSASDKVNITGNLASFITIPDQYQTAIEAALADRLAALLVPNEANLWQLLQEQDAKSSVTVLALANLQPAASPALPSGKNIIGWAVDLVQHKSEIAPAVQLLLGQILLVEDEQTAFAVSQSLPGGATAVSRNGFVTHAGGLVIKAGQEGQNSVLAREAAWRKATEALTALQQTAAEQETAVVAQHQEIDAQQAEADQLQTEENRLAGLMNEARQRVSRAQRDADRQKQQLGFIERQAAAKQEALARLQERIVTIESKIETDQAQLVSLETAASEAQTQLESLPVAEAQQQRQNLRQDITSAQTIVAGRQAVVDSRRATLNQFEQQLNRLQVRQNSLQTQQNQYAASNKDEEQQKLQAQLEALDTRITPMKTRLDEARMELNQFEDKTAVLQKETHDAETIFTQAKVRFTQQTNSIENLQERIKADLGIVALHYDDEQFGPNPLPISGVQALPVITELPDDIEETIQNYRGQMQRLGAINPDAPEEFRETEDRFNFMTQQVEDLNATEAHLRDIIAELDELTSRAFAETVDKVNDVFGPTFTQLFGGGSGRLVLTDPDDLTVSGVDIIARLPNRREQGLGLLSGGERSLTAVALIFSLLKVSPTPFCIMDEVDAALDEANVNRFRDLLRELSINTQFIVITHNRGTVQAAQTIYGISMGTDSASQAISIKPEDYIKQPELI